MRQRIDLVKYGGEDDSGSSGGDDDTPAGGCGDGDGCGRS